MFLLALEKDPEQGALIKPKNGKLKSASDLSLEDIKRQAISRGWGSETEEETRGPEQALGGIGLVLALSTLSEKVWTKYFPLLAPMSSPVE